MSDRSGHPNLLFVFADQMRSTAMGCAGIEKVKTPHFDLFASQGTRFTNAISNTPSCTPARASILTGLHTMTHGLVNNDLTLDPDLPTIAHALSGAGYRCGYIGKVHLDGPVRTAFAPPGPKRHGFDDFWAAAECNHSYHDAYYYLNDDPEPRWFDGYEPDGQTDLAVEYIHEKKQGDDPFCLFLSWAPPHCPYRDVPQKYLLEHGWTAKNNMHVYNEIGHIPLFIHLPQGQGAGTQINALTQNIDIMPTMCDFYELETPDSVKGESLLPLLNGETDELRDACIYGWYGKAVNVTDGRHTYLRIPQRPDNSPCHSYSSILDTLNRFVGVPNVFHGKKEGEFSADRFEVGPFLKHTSYPVFKVPFENCEIFCASNAALMEEGTLLFDMEQDYAQEHPLCDPEIETQMIEKLRECMIEADSPDEQFERLGI